MQNIKAVIFDVDGLLLNTEFLWLQAWNDVGEKYGEPAFGKAFYRTVGLTGKAVNAILDEELSGCPNRNELLVEVRKTGVKYLEEKIDIMPGVKDLLDLLDEKGIIKAVATTTNRLKTDERLKKLGLYDRFSIIVCGDEVTKRKPNPEIYQTILKKLGVGLDKVLVLEDTGYGVKAAYDAGVKVIMVPSINPATEEEKKMAYAIVHSLDEVVLLFKEGKL